MTTTGTGRRRRWLLGGVRLGWGVLLLSRAGTVADAMGAPPGSAATLVARLLGGRQVAQALVELAWWPRYRRLGAAVDLAHAASGVLATTDDRWRRPASIDAAVATGFAAGGLVRRRAGAPAGGRAEQ